MSQEAIDRACLSPRHPPYRMIHKALRLAMMQCLGRLGSVDASDNAALLAALDEVEQLLALCEGHLKHEDRFMHPPLRERCPAAVQDFDAEHAAQTLENAVLRARVAVLRRSVEAQPGLLHALYLALSRYVAAQFEHMAEEESILTEALWAHFSEEEIAAIESALVASIEPDERGVITVWMLRACHHTERLRLLESMRPAMPEAAFEALLRGLAGQLPAMALSRLRLAMDGVLRGEAA